MKKKLILVTLVMSLIVPLLSFPATSSASGEKLPSYDYMILGDAVYRSSKSSTLAQELVAAQKGQKAQETFSDKTEKRMSDSWIKFSYYENKSTNFTAASYYNPTRNEIVIAFAGTDNVLDDWIGVRNTSNIAAILAKRSHEQKKFAESYAMDVAVSIGKATYIHPKTKKKTTIKSNAKIVMTGHSLGGYLVQVAGIHLMSDKYTAGKFKAGYTFNSLGIGQADVTKTQWSNNKAGKYNKFVHFNVSWEFVGTYNQKNARILAGSPNGRVVAHIKDKLSNSFYNHQYKGLYRHFKWE